MKLIDIILVQMVIAHSIGLQTIIPKKLNHFPTLKNRLAQNMVQWNITLFGEVHYHTPPDFILYLFPYIIT